MPNPNLYNISPLNRYEATTATAADSMGLTNNITGGVLATVVDLGVTTFNSLTPESMDANTADLLGRINSNALQVYEENPETIRAASFVTGLVLPVGLSIKAMGMMRSGMKGANWFNNQGRVNQLAKVDKAYKNAGASSAEYKLAKGQLYKGMAVNAVADNVAAEAAILATLNAHPWMEDYQKDLGTNFLISVALGGAIQSGIGTLTTRAAVRKMAANTDKEFAQIAAHVFGATPVNRMEHTGVQLAGRNQRVEDLGAWIAAAEDAADPLVLSQITVDSLKVVKLQEEGRFVNDFLAMSSDEIKALETVDRDFFLDRVKRIDFAGIDALKFATVNSKQHARIDRNVNKGLKETVDLFVSKITKSTGEVKLYPRDAIYSPVHKAWFSMNEGVDYLTIADLNTTLKELSTQTDNTLGRIARSDQSLINLVESSARIEADFAKTLLVVDKMDIDQIGKLVVASDDLSMLKAIQARLSVLSKTGDVSKVRIKVSGKVASAEAREIAVLNKAGVAPGFLHNLRKLAATDWDNYTVPTTMKELSTTDAIATLRKNPNSAKLRNMASRQADSEGFVYLYKTTGKTPTGVAIHTLLPSGKVDNALLYRVHVDDILGTITQDAKKQQILVRQSEKLTEEQVTRNAIPLVPVGEATTPKVTQLTSDTIASHLAQTNSAEIITLSRLNLGVEAIALRTGTPVSAVNAVLSGDAAGQSFTKFNSVADVEEALKVTNKALQVHANVDKIPTAEMAANLNAQTLDSISQGVIEYYLKTSSSPFVRKIAEDLTTAEIRAQIHFLKESLPDLLPSNVKSSLFRSADSVLEDLGAIGQYATALGKQRINAGNSVLDNITRPMSNIFAEISLDATKTIELNTAINLNAGQSGYRFYKDGQFWRFGDAPGAGSLSIDDMLAMDNKTFRGFANTVDNSAGYETYNVLPIKMKDAEYRVVSPEVREALDIMQHSGRDMYHLANAQHQAIGKGMLNDIGLWIPAFNVRDKQIAYVFNKVTQETSMIMAKTTDELNDGIKSYEASQGAAMKNIDIIRKDQQEAYNAMAGRHDPMYMSVADVSRQKSGAAASAIVSTGTDIMTDIIRSYDSQINRHLDNIFELQLAPIITATKNLSDISQMGFSDAATGIVGKMAGKPVDPGAIIKNIIMGKPNINQSPAWAAWQQPVQVATDLGLKTISNILAPVLSPLMKGAATSRNADDWTRVVREMEDKGIVNPFQVFDTLTGQFRVSNEFGKKQFLSQAGLEVEALTPRTVALGNALAATSLLRFAELSQPLVNMLSLPILTSAAVRRDFAKSLGGAKLTSDPVFSVAKTMMDGVRLMNHSTASKKWDDLADQANLYGRDWQEVNGIMQQSRKVDPGILSSLENALESNVVKMMSKPADMSEGLVRRVTFFTGITLAKRAYPGISDAGAMTFARDFMDKSIGNYTAAQRPAMFQGTFGMGLGLFQTYMLTLAQSMFRQIEQRQFAELGKMMLVQGTIFGSGSLPGFHLVSETIGEHFSDDSVDLTTGTFRALPNKAAELLLYGLPSQLIGIHTRGDIQPRVPNPFQGLNSVAAINLTGQMFKAMKRTATAAFTVDESAGIALLESLSLQSVSRPLARISELATGHSITARGNIVSKDAEMYTVQSIASRIFAARPLAEIKAREAMHLDSLYSSLDQDRRSVLTNSLKSHLRNGSLHDEKVDRLAFEYLRTGSPEGWRSAVNTAIAQVRNPGSHTVVNALHPNSPTLLMIDDLEGGN